MKIAMFGHKRIPSRESGVEVVVTELATRMAVKGHKVTCYNRSGNNKSFENEEGFNQKYKDIRIKNVWTINARGIAQ